MTSGARVVDQVMAASGGQPTSTTGKSMPRIRIISRMAGLIWVTKKENTIKTPANPAPIRTVERIASAGRIRATSARISMKAGRIT